jgi:cytochrome c-type biogenesis protein CcmH/NrfG
MRRASTGRRWTVLGMAFGALAGAGGPFGQRLWDDPAFQLYRDAAEAMDRRDHEGAAALARHAIRHYPEFVLAHFLLGQAALALGQWQDAATAFRTVVTLYPGSIAGRRALQTAVERAGRETAEAPASVTGQEAS